MKLNKFMMAAMITFGISSMANAADQGNGQIKFAGSIIDAPCSIAYEESHQLVQLGQISKLELKNGGTSNPRPFSIELENCEIGDQDNNKVTLTFTGGGTTGGLLSFNSTQAKGAKIAITDGAGKLIKMGVPTDPRNLTNGDNTLDFTAYLQGDGASATISEGKFTATADFTLAYQ